MNDENLLEDVRDLQGKEIAFISGRWNFFVGKNELNGSFSGCEELQISQKHFADLTFRQ